MDLTQAYYQWSSRPPDERFESLAALHIAAAASKGAAKQATAQTKLLRVEASLGDIVLKGPDGGAARLTNWSFAQLADRADVRPSYCARIPATLAAQNVNYGLSVAEGNGSRLLLESFNPIARESQLLYLLAGEVTLAAPYRLRAITSTDYTRIWDVDVVEKLIQLGDEWRVPPARPAFPNQPGTRPATAGDVVTLAKTGMGIKVGDPIAPAGLYRSDRDSFVFLVNESRLIDAGDGTSLARGFFVWNSEVGARSFGVSTFLYRSVCGNHIVWGAENVSEIRLRHVGAVDERFARQLTVELRRYSETSATQTEQWIVKARSFELGTTKDDVLELLFDKKIASRKVLEASYESTEQNPSDGNPRSAWGMVQGLTRVSQAAQNADKRHELDRAAGRVLELVRF